MATGSVTTKFYSASEILKGADNFSVDLLLQLLGLHFLEFVALFGDSSPERLSPYHPKTKNLKD